MSQIRSRDTLPERVLRATLWRAGLRYRLDCVPPVGRPDIVFPGRKVAVFIDGCFWHGCPEHYLRPRTREAYWAAKLTLNTDRDRRQTISLESEGWRVCRAWEHEIFEDLSAVVAEVTSAVRDPFWTAPSRQRVIRVEEVQENASWELRYLQAVRGSSEILVEVLPRRARMWSRTKELARLREQHAVAVQARRKGRTSHPAAVWS